MEKTQKAPENCREGTLVVRLNDLLDLRNTIEFRPVERLMFLCQHEENTIWIDRTGDSIAGVGQERLSAEERAELLGPIVAAGKTRQWLQARPIPACENDTPAMPGSARANRG